MRILFVTSQVLPLVADDIGEKKSGFGGWIMNMLNQLKNIDDIQLAVAMCSKKINKMFEKNCEGINCYVAPDNGDRSMDENSRNYIVDAFKPDIVHIEGNEFPIHNIFSKVKQIPTLLSLQGILSGYEPYQYGQLPIADFLFSPKRHNVISSWVLYFRKHLLFDKRVLMETDTIKNAQFLTGRTFWDRAHSYWINPDAKYFVCNRILRPEFYEEIWDSENYKKHTIYVGNGYSPLKGIHNVLEAVALLKKEFPDIKVCVSGLSPIVKGKRLNIRKFGYSNLIEKIIKKHNIQENVVFTGSLNGKEMIEYMKKSNVYVLPSLIENSPNTLGEAMILGMPCVSAYTGGASEMAIDEKECLFYRANDPKLLAWQIRRVFTDNELAKNIGGAARLHAKVTHDPLLNRDALINIYKKILEKNE